jgi:DNA-directed RNA polymerase subunit H (RpoH/RPB5)
MSRKRSTKDLFVIDNINLIQQHWTCYVNIGKMLRARGCDYDETEDIINISFIDFKKMLADTDNVIPVITIENENRKYLTHVTMYPLDTVQKKSILVHLENLISQDLLDGYSHNIIFVGTDKSTPKIKKIFADRPFVKGSGKRIIYETFLLSFFFENLIDNHLVDPTREVPKEEIAELVAKDPTFVVTALPVLLTTDPISAYYGFPSGTVVEVKRTDEVFATGMTMYRYVMSQRQLMANQG